MAHTEVRQRVDDRIEHRDGVDRPARSGVLEQDPDGGADGDEGPHGRGDPHRGGLIDPDRAVRKSREGIIRSQHPGREEREQLVRDRVRPAPDILVVLDGARRLRALPAVVDLFRGWLRLGSAPHWRMPRWLAAEGEIGAGYAQEVWLGHSGDELTDPALAWQSQLSADVPDFLTDGQTLPRFSGRHRDGDGDLGIRSVGDAERHRRTD